MRADLEFLRRFRSSMADMSDKPRVVAFVTSSYPFLALLVHETDKQFSRVSGVEGSTFLDGDAAEVIRRARHSLKFFDDSKLGFDGYLALFSRALAKDDGDQDTLGLMFIDGRIVSSTPTFTVFSGALTSDLSSTGSVAEAIGSFVSRFGFDFEPGAVSAIQRSSDVPVGFTTVTGSTARRLLTRARHQYDKHTRPSGFRLVCVYRCL